VANAVLKSADGPSPAGRSSGGSSSTTPSQPTAAAPRDMAGTRHSQTRRTFCGEAVGTMPENPIVAKSRIAKAVAESTARMASSSTSSNGAPDADRSRLTKSSDMALSGTRLRSA
jgi:hypothetical protein